MTGSITEAFLIAICILSLVSFPLSIWAIIEVLGFKRSTHRVQFVDPLALQRPPEPLSKPESDTLDKLNANSVDPNYRHIDRFWSGQ